MKSTRASQVIKYCYFLLCGAVLLLPGYWLPALEEAFNWQIKEISQPGSLPQKPAFHAQRFLAGHHQRDYSEAVKMRHPARRVLVRLRNQLVYNTFGSVGNTNYFLHENGHFFDKSYCRAASGYDYIGDDAVQKKVQSIKGTAEYLRKQGKLLLLVLPPGKPRIYPDMLPPAFQNAKDLPTNHGALIKALEEENIAYTDFRNFKNLQTDLDFPLYAQGSLHWGNYAVGLAMQEIADTLGKRQFSLGKLTWEEQENYSKELRPIDTEISRGSNMLGDIDLPPLPYHEFKFSPLPDSLRPRVLAIGDSYYELLYKAGFDKNFFASRSNYLHYFNREIHGKGKPDFPSITQNPEVLKQALNAYDIIIVSAAETNIPSLGFGFFEMMDSLLNQSARE